VKKPEVAVFLFFMAGLTLYELLTGKAFDRLGGAVRRNEHPWMYWMYIAIQIAFLAIFGGLGLYDLYLHLR